MDSQHILEQLASLRENLKAIESARQQVQNNVAQYEKVRLQLSDTAKSIKSIIDGFDTLVNKIDAHQDSLLDDVNDSKATILETLHRQADEIANQSQMSVESLKQAIDSVSNGFNQSVNRNLTLLRDTTSTHLGKYQNFESKISEEINKLSDERKKLEKFADKLNKTIETGFKIINENFEGQASKIEELESSINTKLDSQASQIETLASSSTSQAEEVKGAVKKSMIISIIAVILMMINLIVLLIR